ncbi:MAG: GNVR domain-containing protein [Chloroherpetonaceae bacterium]
MKESQESAVLAATLHEDSVSADLIARPLWARLLEVLIRYRKWIIVTTLSTTALSTLIAFLLPVWFLASSVILVGQQSDVLNLSKLLGVSAGLASDLLGKNKLSDEVDRYEAIFKSERLRLAVIEKFDLIKEYEFDSPDVKEPIKNTLKELDANISFKDNKNGTITISAIYKENAEKSAEMAQFIVAMMDSINRQLATESARNQRIFIERKYIQAQEELARAEVALNMFQKQYKVPEIKDQIRASLEASAQIESAAITSEVEYNVLKDALGENHPQVLQAKSKVQELKRQVKRFEQGGLSSDIIIPFEKMPDVGMEYMRLYRNLLLQTKIVEFLTTQYEQAKIQEAKDTPTLLVLDKARVPEWKAKPKRLFIILGGMVIGFILSVAIIFLYLETQTPEFQRWKFYFGNVMKERV